MNIENAINTLNIAALCCESDANGDGDCAVVVRWPFVVDRTTRFAPGGDLNNSGAAYAA